MKCLIQRVLEAKVTVDGDTRGAIGEGLLVLVGFEPGDSPAVIKKMAENSFKLEFDRFLNFNPFILHEFPHNLSDWRWIFDGRLGWSVLGHDAGVIFHPLYMPHSFICYWFYPD